MTEKPGQTENTGRRSARRWPEPGSGAWLQTGQDRREPILSALPLGSLSAPVLFLMMKVMLSGEDLCGKWEREKREMSKHS